MMRVKYFRRLLLTLPLLYTLAASAAPAAAPAAREKAASAAEVKKRIAKLGVGVAAHVRLRLRDGMQIEGYVEQAGEDHFYLVRTDEKGWTARIIAYADVAELKGKRAALDWRNINISPRFGANFIVRCLEGMRTPALKP